MLITFLVSLAMLFCIGSIMYALHHFPAISFWLVVLVIAYIIGTPWE